MTGQQPSDRDDLETVAEKAASLVGALDKCAPEISSAFFMAFGRMGQVYRGPTYHRELKALRRALAMLPGQAS